jgi:hypothetical protein
VKASARIFVRAEDKTYKNARCQDFNAVTTPLPECLFLAASSAHLRSPMQGIFMSLPASAHPGSPMQGVFLSFRISMPFVRTVLILVLIQVVLSLITPILMTWALRSRKVSSSRTNILDPLGWQDDTVEHAPLHGVKMDNSAPALQHVLITPQSVQVLLNGSTSPR